MQASRAVRALRPCRPRVQHGGRALATHVTQGARPKVTHVGLAPQVGVEALAWGGLGG